MTTTANHHPADLDALARYPGISAVVTGTADELAEQIRRAEVAGRLLSMSVTLDKDGQIFVHVRLRALPTPIRPVRSAAVARPPQPRRSRRRVHAVAATVTVLVAIVVLVAVLVVKWLLAHLGVIVAGLVIAGLVLIAVGRACPGVVVHCRGCKH